MGTHVEFADFSAVAEVVNQIAPVISGCERNTGLMALLVLFITIQHPEISEDELIVGVEGASRWVTEYLEGLSMGMLEPVAKEKMN